jgi:hypothetical protein
MVSESIVGLHDANFYAVTILDNPRSLLLGIKSESSESLSLVLKGCRRFRIVDFSSQNIVERILISRGSKIDRVNLKECLEWMTASVDSGPLISLEEIDSLAEKIIANELMLVNLIPSFGAELIAVCEQIVNENSSQPVHIV